MFFLSGTVVSILTFPGVIVHEAAHRFFCDLAGVRVIEICYFRAGNPAGYVVHEATDSLPANFLISAGPLFVNTLLCMLLCFSPMIILSLDVRPIPIVPFFLLWLGLSIGMHAFPSDVDMRNFTESVERAKGIGILRLAAAMLRLVFRVANALRIVWFDLFYAIAVAWILPVLVLVRRG